MKIAIIFGGKSREHEVSIVSASNVLCNINKEKYEIYPIYLDKENNWYKVKDKFNGPLNIGEYPKKITKINPWSYLKNIDVVFPMIHGDYGEDGSLQGFLKMLNVKYIGCDILSSSICIDKSYTKYLLKNAGILTAPDILIKYEKNNYYLLDDFNKTKVNISKIDELIKNRFNYPVFVKPASLGSSVGVSKANGKNELVNSLSEAIKYDKKILIEKEIKGRELECAILNGKAIGVGEIHAHGTFYSYYSKYNDNLSKSEILSDFEKNIINKVKKIAEKAFIIVNGSNLARIDFFLENDTNNIYLNEINTLPGFTDISMYPKIIASAGISYKELIDILIEDCLSK